MELPPYNWNMDKMKVTQLHKHNMVCPSSKGLNRKTSKEWPLSSNIESEVKFIAKNLTVSDKDEITSRSFALKGTDSLPLLRITFENFQNS